MPIVYQTDTSTLARTLAGGLVAAIILGGVWGLLNTAGLGQRTAYDWGFWFALLLGFGVAETVSFLAKRRRGTTLQGIAIGCVLLGFVISRVIINARLVRPLTLDQFVSQTVTVTQGLRINLVTILFVALACLIAWRRFR